MVEYTRDGLANYIRLYQTEQFATYSLPVFAKFNVTDPHNFYVRMQGYKQKRGFIVAQAPMSNTAGDFWKMVYEREVAVIVMLSEFNEDGKVNVWAGLVFHSCSSINQQPYHFECMCNTS